MKKHLLHNYWKINNIDLSGNVICKNMNNLSVTEKKNKSCENISCPMDNLKFKLINLIRF